MRTKLLLALVMLSIGSLGLKAHAQVAVNDMTCAEAVAYVEKNKRYYTMTVDGPIPIYPVKPVSTTPTCGHKESLFWIFHETTDNERCHIGYLCESTG